jgi:hypothetical protein
MREVRSDVWHRQTRHPEWGSAASKPSFAE